MKPIETTRLLIRDFLPEDAHGLQSILGDHETMKHCEPAYDFEKTNTFLNSFCIGQRAAVAAVDKQTGKLMGYLLFHESIPGVYEMGWIFNRRYWRQGYACEACKALLDHAFRERRAHKVFAETIDSVKSIPLMQKLGMVCEGVQRSHTRNHCGQWADMYLYGLLEEDWQNQSPAGRKP